MQVVIEIPDNATNGYMIQTLFQDGHDCSDGRKYHYYSFHPHGHLEVTKEWWNTPYKKEEENAISN